MAYFINYLFILIPHGWRFMFGISAIFAFGQGFALLFVPKSPRFLIIKNKPIEALQVLRRLRSDEDSANQELSSLKHHLTSEQNLGWKELCSQKNNLCYRLVIGLGLAFLQQASGLPTILYYAPVVLKQIGFYSNQSATLATIGAGVTKMVAVCISLCAVDRIGRKKLLTIGTVLMALCLFFASALNRPSSVPCQEDNCDNYGEIINSTDNEYVSNATTEQVSASLPVSTCLSLVCMLCYIAAYSISYGPVTWLLLSEIFPSSIKGRSIALVVAANWTFNLVFSFTFLDYLERTGIMWTFITYGTSCSIGLLFVLNVVPETKGRTLEEIDNALNKLSVLRELKLRCASSVCADSGSSRASYEPLSQGPLPEPALRTSSADSHTESAI
ncbi:SLC2A12 [Bugula neritina]|uniref:SLC2A12 n=1 Tax=Bugula neritina TaxID=10212 RepID=A0A7J7KT75_BUGNE|nr:SLC2A12 [Bugula neritina]